MTQSPRTIAGVIARRLLQLALLALAVCLAATCSCRDNKGAHEKAAPQAAADPGPPKHGGVLIMGTTWLPTLLDPIVRGNNAHIRTSLLLYDQLVRVRKDGLGAEPGLAESWDVSPDGLVYTFHLRPGLTFSDGQPLRASDVKFSLQRAATDPKSVGAIVYPSFVRDPDPRRPNRHPEAQGALASCPRDPFALHLIHCPRGVFQSSRRRGIQPGPNRLGPIHSCRAPQRAARHPQAKSAALGFRAAIPR